MFYRESVNDFQVYRRFKFSSLRNVNGSMSDSLKFWRREVPSRIRKLYQMLMEAYQSYQTGFEKTECGACLLGIE